MRKVTWAALAVIALGSALGAIVASRGSPPPPTRDPRWRLDISYVARKLPVLRAGGLGGVSPAAWDAAARRLEAEVPRLTDGQLTVGLARLVAMLHDDETQVEIGDRNFYPVVARWFGNALYLVVVPRADRAALGSRLLAVDGRPIAQVMASIGTTIDYQDPTLHANTELSYLRDPALLHWLGITSSATSAVLSVESAGGGEQAIRVAPVSSWASVARVPQPLYEQDQSAPYWMRILAGQSAVYLKYNQCLSGNGFQRLAAQALWLLKAHPDYRLVMDLRDNGGGDSAPFQYLIGGIRADPRINRPGRVIGLVNEFTDSSATVDAQNLKMNTTAILIGQQPADPMDAWGNEQTVTLPDSDITVEYTTAAINTSGTPWGIPDVTVQPTLSQVLAGDDPVLAAALSYTGRFPGGR